MMFFQDPSINAFQERLQEKRQLNTLKTLFNVTAIPQSTQLKIIIAGDGFYSKQPFIDQLKENSMSFILVAKPTDITITEDNIIELVKGGRARWKIENEAFNTLKNQGYHLEHNFGHGEKHLAYNLLLFNFLAFCMHQIFELSDIVYQKCRAKFTLKRFLL